ncbi:unnamed protein product, partial [Amoebophrya sp. A25]
SFSGEAPNNDWGVPCHPDFPACFEWPTGSDKVEVDGEATSKSLECMWPDPEWRSVTNTEKAYFNQYWKNKRNNYYYNTYYNPVTNPYAPKKQKFVNPGGLTNACN